MTSNFLGSLSGNQVLLGTINSRFCFFSEIITWSGALKITEIVQLSAASPKWIWISKLNLITSLWINSSYCLTATGVTASSNAICMLSNLFRDKFSKIVFVFFFPSLWNFALSLLQAGCFNLPTNSISQQASLFIVEALSWMEGVRIQHQHGMNSMNLHLHPNIDTKHYKDEQQEQNPFLPSASESLGRRRGILSELFFLGNLKGFQ